jgi:hypothetical protein
MTATEYAAMIEAARQEGRADGVARAIAYAESMAKALGEAGEVVRAEEWQDLVRELREGDSGRSLTRLIAEKQAEALEAWADKIREAYEKARVDDRFGDDFRDLVSGAIKGIEERTRERAAAYRKGGAP